MNRVAWLRGVALLESKSWNRLETSLLAQVFQVLSKKSKTLVLVALQVVAAQSIHHLPMNRVVFDIQRHICP